MTRRHDVRRVKRHLNYTACELAQLLRVTLTTISHWRREGLTSIDLHRPYLYNGVTVAEFLARRNKPRQPMGSGEIYCVACKRACTPAGGVADIVARGLTTVDLVGTCPGCGRSVFRRVRGSELVQKAGHLRLRYEDDAALLPACGDAPQNSSLEEELL